MCKKDEVAKVAEEVKRMQSINPVVDGKKQVLEDDSDSSSDEDENKQV